MATDRKNIDPRFDPAFQRGYAERGRGAEPDAVSAARSVDALRDDAAMSAGISPEPSAVGMPLASVPAVTADAASTVSDRDETASVAPQSHYVDAAGALAEIAPPARRRSLARNPFIYVLWAVGVASLYAGTAAQLWASSQLYGTSNVPYENFSFISTVQLIAPAASNLGALCLTAALVVHSVSWMRRMP